MITYRSYPHLSVSTNGTDSTIVPTTPVDPSNTNLGLISPSSQSTSSIYDDQHQQFKKSTSMRFAKLIEHPSKFFLDLIRIRSFVETKRIVKEMGFFIYVNA